VPPEHHDSAFAGAKLRHGLWPHQQRAVAAGRETNAAINELLRKHGVRRFSG